MQQSNAQVNYVSMLCFNHTILVVRVWTNKSVGNAMSG